MKKKIFITGQCTMHWGRMEYGNIGNYYIVAPMFEELRRVFPDFEIATTMQFSKPFCDRFKIRTVSMEWYYDFGSNENYQNAVAEYETVKRGDVNLYTPFAKECRDAGLVIDFSGDIWGDNAAFLGKDRFVTGCYKDLTAQLLAPTVMIAGSPGPFHIVKNLELAKKAYSGFAFVSNREPVSTRILRNLGFEVGRTKEYPCPSFLFKKEESGMWEMPKADAEEGKIKIGLMLCGWNFAKAPFSLWPRKDEEYAPFSALAKHLIDKYEAHIFLLSHSNGFEVPPKPFALKHGRDFPIMSQLNEILRREGYGNSVSLFDGVYLPAQTKAIISQFDLLISGRMHGAVAGLSQNIPTVIIDYGHEPKAHKLKGFAEVVGDSDIIANPNDEKALLASADKLVRNRESVKLKLQDVNEAIKKNASDQFDELRKFVAG